MKQFSTPILFIVFNRLDTAQKVFNEIKKQKPKYLYIAADGPRKGKEGEAEKCQKVRDVVKQIDWDCELKTLFSEENQGCAFGPKNAIEWFFKNVSEGLILEDDCVPHPDFFPYCEEMLQYYRNNENIMVISGNNFQDGIKRGEASYYFTAYSNTWGWASWSRAWENYDFYLVNYPNSEFKKIVKKYFSNWNEQQTWIDLFIRMKNRTSDTWDYQFSFHIWKKGGLCINPNVNLISNIGFGEEATHTKNTGFSALNLETKSILPIQHVKEIRRDIEADRYYYKNQMYKSVLQIIWRWFLRKFIIRKAKF